MKGRFIVLTGIGGSGKSTTMDFLKKNLSPEKFFFTHEPGGDSPFLKEFRRVFKGSWEPPLNAWEHMLMVESMRSYHVRNEILPARSRGLHVVCDRFSESTWGYQICGQRADEEVRQMFHVIDKRSRHGQEPDFNIFFEVALAVAERRHRARACSVDFFDERGRGFQGRVRAGISDHLRFRPHRVVDAEQPPEVLHQEVLAIITEVCGL